jgi:hypothetical protein
LPHINKAELFLSLLGTMAAHCFPHEEITLVFRRCGHHGACLFRMRKIRENPATRQTGRRRTQRAIGA